MDYYQLRIYNPFGKFLRIFDGYEKIKCVRKINSIGAMNIEFSQNLPIEYGTIFQLERSVNNGPMSLFGETVYFATGVHIDGGLTTIDTQDANHLLDWRIVGYNAETPFANKKLPCDDFIKALARENWGDPVNPRRAWDINIAPNYSLAPVADHGLAHDKLITSFNTLCNISSEKGRRLFFDITADYNMNLYFKTYADQRGADRRNLILDENSLTDIKLDIDYKNWATVAFSGGEGDGKDREIVLVVNEEAVKLSRFGWRELFVADQDFTKANEMKDGGENALFKARPKFVVSGTLIDSPFLTYGVHYNFGDFVTARYRGYESPCYVNTLNLTIEKAKSNLEIDFVL